MENISQSTAVAQTNRAAVSAKPEAADSNAPGIMLMPTQEAIELATTFAHLLPRQTALELNAVITDHPQPGRFSVLLLSAKYEIKRDVAVALKTNSYNINYYTKEPMFFDIFFHKVYPEDQNAVGEELARRSEFGKSKVIDGGGADGLRADFSEELVNNWIDSLGRLHLTDTAKLEEYAAKKTSELVALEFAHLILWQSIEQGASDVYLEAGIQTGRVSFLLDDEKQERYANIPLVVFFEILRCMIGAMGKSAAQVMKDVNIDTSIPVRAYVKGRITNFEFRLHSHPSATGTTVVLRSQSELIKDFDKTGMELFQIGAMKKGVRSNNGMVLITGVTGSGKTGTLECCYWWIHNTLRTRHLIEITDTVEVISDWRDQIVVKKGLYEWTDALNAALRSKPHKLGYGELRDVEATEKAVETAMTGHLVMATYHATSVGRTIDRLRQMGVDIQRLAASLNLIQSQVLVNKICPNPKCHRVDEELSEQWNRVVYKPGNGCEICERPNAVVAADEEDSRIGYKGMTVIAETLTLTEDIEDMIIADAPVSEILDYAVKEGLYVPFSITGRMKIWNGVTSAREIEKKLGKSFSRFHGMENWAETEYFEGERDYQDWVIKNLGKDETDHLSRALKLRELAHNGVGGERETARTTYQAHLLKHNLRDEDVKRYGLNLSAPEQKVMI